MDLSTDNEVLRAAVDWLEQGSAVTLVTVAQTWGSAPRRPGALMVIHADGRFQGSVSGGCIEDDLVQRVLRGEFEHRPPKIIEYGINTPTSRRVGLPCGGRLHLLVEHIDVATQLATVLASIDGRQRIARRVCLNSGEASLHTAADIETFSFDGDNLVKDFGPAWRMLIIGAGELARRVSQLALTLDYAVTLCDSRPEYASGWQVEGTEFSVRPPAQLVESFAPDEHTAVLALAHAPALEDEAIASALNSTAFYVGALGSRKNQRARIGRLLRMGVCKTQLARLHGPVGLDIGSHTPAEIAIAIIAHLIATRNGQNRMVARVESQDG
ncbi:MAG: XdhC family protein [Gammaproteobacteria bacterium]|nr:XdhC family protein [Gammaproteobacteria bacterium]